MKAIHSLALVLSLASQPILLVSAEKVAPAAEPTQLQITDSKNDHLREFIVDQWPSNGKLVLQGPLPSILRATLAGTKKPIEFSFNRDASKVTLHVPGQSTGSPPARIQFLIAEETSVLADGTVILSALDSEVVGQQAKLESHPGSHRIGFWGNAADYVQWEYRAPPGEYAAELVYSRATPDGTVVEISIDDSVSTLELSHTGSWYRYRNVPIGDVELIGNAHTATVRVQRIVNGGVMNLKAIILTPQP